MFLAIEFPAPLAIDGRPGAMVRAVVADDVLGAVGPVQKDVFVHVGRAVDLAEAQAVDRLPVHLVHGLGNQSVHLWKIIPRWRIDRIIPLGDMVGLALEGKGHVRHVRGENGISLVIHGLDEDVDRVPINDDRPQTFAPRHQQGGQKPYAAKNLLHGFSRFLQ